MKRKLTQLVVCALGLALVSHPALAFLGFGDIVFDPTNYAQALERFYQLQQQYQQLVLTYQMVRNQYDQMVWMAKRVPVDMRIRYRALATPWNSVGATNIYGTTGSWINGMNTGAGVASGYGLATEPLAAYGSALDQIPGDQVSRIKTNYATVELTDGANIAAMQTIGQLRGNAPAIERTIQSLEDDSLSSDPAMNTEIAVLNKINAADLIAVRNAQDTNKLLASLAEQQVIETKRKRDAEAQAINQHIRFRTEGREMLSAQAASASQAMLAWRMP